MKDYSTYRCVDFASDQTFIDWVKHPDDELDTFWTSLMATNSLLCQKIVDARLIVQSMQFVEKELPEPEVQALWYSIINHSRKNHSIRYYWRIAVACAASIAIIFGVWKWLGDDVGQQYDALIDFAVNFAAPVTADSDVQLVLSDNTNYFIASNDSEIKYDEKGKLTVDSQEVVNQTAPSATAGEIQFNQIIVPWGKRTTISFADGSKLCLNAGSRAVYPVEFTEKSREIFIDGEGYFEVAKDERRPFIVKTGMIEIKVLGTIFNVNAYSQDGKTEVALVNGSVQVVYRNQQATQLQPDHVVEIDHTTDQQLVKYVNINDYVCWKEGFLQFCKEKPDVVLRRIERYYATPIIIETQLDEYTISGKLDLRENITSTLEIIEKLIPVRYQIDNNKIFIRKK